MTAPPRRRRSRGASATPAPSTTVKSSLKDNPPADEFDYDERIVYQVDASIWRAIYNGEFRLAVRCKRCGRWLTSGASKKAHMGSVCASKAGQA